MSTLQRDLFQERFGRSGNAHRVRCAQARIVKNKYFSWVDDNSYRVYIQPTSNKVDVVCIGICEKVRGEYDSVSDLPQWMQTKLAALMITSPIEGVGERKDRHVFYIYGGEWK